MFTTHPSEANSLIGITKDDRRAFYKSLDKNNDKTVQCSEVTAWLESSEAHEALARTFARFAETTVAPITGVVALGGNFVNGLMQAAERQYIVFDDIARTIPIDSGYVGTLAFESEQGDKDYLMTQGRQAVERFARDLRGER
jgi:hypothetical protein